MYGEIILQLICEFQSFSEKTWNVESYKEDFECSFQFRKVTHDID